MLPSSNKLNAYPQGWDIGKSLLWRSSGLKFANYVSPEFFKEQPGSIIQSYRFSDTVRRGCWEKEEKEADCAIGI